ncbi:MAG: hypothetical protein ABI742_11370 [Gemmatimonadota bacterium]
MTFARVLLAWSAVTLCFAVWRELERRITAAPESMWPALRTALPILAVEAALLTLFAGLWFASLGSSGAVPLFVIVGALMEIPARLRNRPAGGVPWKPMVGGVLRIVIAGLLLGVVMG